MVREEWERIFDLHFLWRGIEAFGRRHQHISIGELREHGYLLFPSRSVRRWI